MQVHNLMEEIVRNCLRDLVSQQEHLKNLTSKEQSDIMAIALNGLPPKYVSTTQGEMYAKTQLLSQVESDVYRELSYSIDKVLKTVRKIDFPHTES